MSCTQTLSGIAKDCATSVGGVREVMIADADAIASVTETTGKITAITPVSETSKPFYRYYMRQGAAHMDSTLNIDTTNGVNYVETLLTLMFTKMDTAKRVEMSSLAVGELVVIVRDMNGSYWYLGQQNPVMANSGDGLTGTAIRDGNRYSIVLRDINGTFPAEINVGTGTGQVDLDDLVN